MEIVTAAKAAAVVAGKARRAQKEVTLSER
jgi:hypothetical protein